MTNPGLLIVISGPSGTGKGTICRSLFQRRPDIFFSVSATTRPPRDGEIDGKNYHFLNKEKFEEMLAQDEFLEWASVYDNYYGTPKKPVINALANGKDVLLEIDIQGALKIKEKAPQGVYIFIAPPSLDVLRTRIINRGTDSLEVINKRMGQAQSELERFQEYNYVVINDKLEDAVDKVESIIIAEQCRADRFKLTGGSGTAAPLIRRLNSGNLLEDNKGV